jgi:hypothetical protein
MRIINAEEDQTETYLLPLDKWGKFHAGNVYRQGEDPLLADAVVKGQA